ncbi:MAG: hypothetical protein ABGX20_00480 [Bacillus sp. (in: firmicutes)]
MEVQILIPALSVLCSALSLMIGIVAFSRSRDREVRNDASEIAVIKTKLDSIINGVSNIQIEIKANEIKVTELSEKIIRLEESINLAQKRIDKLEDQLKKNKENIV